MEKITVVKVGGAVLENRSDFSAFLNRFKALKGRKILVHGGGKRANAVSEKMGIKTKIFNGRRITDAASLMVAQMVYTGIYNSEIVAQLHALGIPALGFNGADAALILAEKRLDKEKDWGFVGDIKSVDSKRLIQFMQLGFTPVFSAITHNGKGQLLNTNADSVATELAIALSKCNRVTLNYCFEEKGVLLNPEQSDKVIQMLNRPLFQSLTKGGAVTDGMLPKLENAFYALEKGVDAIYIKHFKQVDKNEAGTRIVI